MWCSRRRHRDFSTAKGLVLTSKSSGRPPGTTPDCKDRAVPLAAVRRSIESRVHSKALIALECHEQRARTCDNTRASGGAYLDARCDQRTLETTLRTGRDRTESGAAD